MHCRQCDYALWNLTEAKCPECGSPFDVGDYVFERGTVAFACPLCGHEHDGMGPLYQPWLGRDSTCRGCGERVDRATMRVIPRNARARATLRDPVPWENRRDKPSYVAWWRTMTLVLKRPGDLAQRFPRGGSHENDWMWFVFVTAAVIAALHVVALTLILAPQQHTANHIVGALVLGGLLSVGAALIVGVWACLCCALGGLAAHLIVRVAGGQRGSMETTMQCICYSQGMLVFTMAPLIGLLLFIPAQIVAMVQCTRMLASVQRINVVAAGFASAVVPGLCTALYLLLAAGPFGWWW